MTNFVISLNGLDFILKENVIIFVLQKHILNQTT